MLEVLLSYVWPHDLHHAFKVVPQAAIPSSSIIPRIPRQPGKPRLSGTNSGPGPACCHTDNNQL